MRFARYLIVSALFLGGCASGRPVAESPEALKPPPKGQTRIVVYRTSILGFAVQPTVNVNGRPTGACTPNAAFYVHVPAGRHDVSATTEVTRTVQVDTSRDPVSYVECSIGLGFLIGQPHLSVSSPTAGPGQVAPLTFTGTH